jgi:PAS domain S-box-containing protein
MLLIILLSISWLAMPVSGLAAGLDKVTLQLKWKHQFQFAGYYAAIEKGYYRDVGLEVELLARESGPERPVDTVLNGTASYGVEGSQLLVSRMQGKPLVALAAIFQHSPTVAISLQNNQIHTAKDMVGKRVMSYGGTDVELYAMLMQEGVSVDRVAWQPMSYSIDSLVAGETDMYSGYLTNEPFFLWQKQMPISIINPINYGIDFYGDILFTTEQELSGHPLRVAAFRQASLKGWQYAIAHPEEIVDLILQKYRPEKSRDHLLYEARESIKLIQPEVVEIGHINPGRLERMADVLKKLGRVEDSKVLSGFVYGAISRENLTTDELAWLASHKKVRVLAGHAPPLMYDDGLNPPRGLLVDYLQKLTDAYGIAFEYRRMSWLQALESMHHREDLDMMPALWPSRERQRKFALSKPFLNLPWVIFAREKADFIGGVEDLAGQRISHPRGFVIGNLLQENYPQIELVEVDTVPQALELLSSGQVDAYIGGLLLTSHLIKDLGIGNIKVAAPFPFQKPEHVLGVRKDWPELVSLFNRVLSQMSPQEHAKIRHQWLQLHYEYGVSKKDVLTWSGIALLLILSISGLFWVWNRSLQKEIKNRSVTEDALVNSVLQYQNLVQVLPHGIVEVDKNLTIIYCNIPIAEMLGYEARELLGKRFSNLIVGSDLSKQLTDMIRSGPQEERHQSLKLQLLDKRLQVLDARVDFDYDTKLDGGQIIIVTDLTRQEQAEKALQKSEEIYRDTFENIQAGVALLGADGRIARANQFLCSMLGYSATEIEEMTFLQLTDAADLQITETLFRDLLKQKIGTYSHSNRCLKKDGSSIWVLVSVALLQEFTDDLCFVIVVQDIDLIKRQQEEVREQALNLETIIDQRTGELQKRVAEVEELNLAMINLTEDLQHSYRQLEEKSEEVRDINKELESFAYSISHDLRAPLRHVQGFADILLECSQDELSDGNRGHLRTIMDSASRMGLLIDDLLAFSRAGRSELRLQPVSTATICKEVISGFSDATAGQDIDWQLGTLPVVTGDLATLRQVFINLLDNAVKYSSPREKSVIRVACEQAADEYIFCVSDNGVGFDPEYKHKLFGV